MPLFDLCDRCGKYTAICLSTFNLEWICDACKRKEREHPDFDAAREAINKAVAAHVYNFPGIGKPDDL